MKLNKKTIAVSTTSLLIIGGTAFAYFAVDGGGTGTGSVATDTAPITLGTYGSTGFPAASTTDPGLTEVFTGDTTTGSTTKTVKLYAQNTGKYTYRISDLSLNTDATNGGIDTTHGPGGISVTDTNGDVVYNTSTLCASDLSAASLSVTGASGYVDVPPSTDPASPDTVEVGQVEITYTVPAPAVDNSACVASGVSVNLAVSSS